MITGWFFPSLTGNSQGALGHCWCGGGEWKGARFKGANGAYVDPTPSNDRERFGVTHQDSISTSKFFKQGTHHYRTRVVCQVSEHVPFVFTMVKT